MFVSWFSWRIINIPKIISTLYPTSSMIPLVCMMNFTKSSQKWWGIFVISLSELLKLSSNFSRDIQKLNEELSNIGVKVKSQVNLETQKHKPLEEKVFTNLKKKEKECDEVCMIIVACNEKQMRKGKRACKQVDISL